MAVTAGKRVRLQEKINMGTETTEVQDPVSILRSSFRMFSIRERFREISYLACQTPCLQGVWRMSANEACLLAPPIVHRGRLLQRDLRQMRKAQGYKAFPSWQHHI
jgi:hypothetical protein